MLAKSYSQKTPSREQLWTSVSQPLTAASALLNPTDQRCKAVKVQSLDRWQKPSFRSTVWPWATPLNICLRCKFITGLWHPLPPSPQCWGGQENSPSAPWPRQCYGTSKEGCMGREGWLGHKVGVRVCAQLSISFLLLFLGKYATTSLSEKQSVFLLPCQTLQGKHYRLNCLIPICIIQRSDNCKNRDAKGRLRATYACCQPFAVGKAKLRTSAGTSSPAGSSTPTSPLFSRSLSHPCDPPHTHTCRVFTALWWGFQPYFSIQIFLPRDCLV